MRVFNHHTIKLTIPYVSVTEHLIQIITSFCESTMGNRHEKDAKDNND